LESKTFSEAVDELKNTKTDAPCYIIVGGMEPNEGIVLARNREGTDHTVELSDENWYVAQTNADWWKKEDPRFNKTIQMLENVGQSNIEADTLINDVLHSNGVLQEITIF
jgi:acid ceramidase